ncbi:hypothetical protein AB1Y20_005443 [Prymnesium parvum]|uniref:Uncharacterized protein n=1 Tax=Prymnesium parvum TaxID=97485 RepID=A0AB34J4A7_PRYPA|mmetsp:Transcript_32275/g.80381  ORF Transcript_32275/g.80381 Transcript_32275/m.80381 type:complete len:124 (-) Transcript_32275:197-568(-)
MALRSLLLLLLAAISSVQALVMQGLTGQLSARRAAAEQSTRLGGCPCMACRTNLKKEKRLRNRVNAFRFKKGGPVRFVRPGQYTPEDAKKASEDAEFYSLVYSYSAAAEAEDSEESSGKPSQN